MDINPRMILPTERSQTPKDASCVIPVHQSVVIVEGSQPIQTEKSFGRAEMLCTVSGSHFGTVDNSPKSLKCTLSLRAVKPHVEIGSLSLVTSEIHIQLKGDFSSDQIGKNSEFHSSGPRKHTRALGRLYTNRQLQGS